MKKPGTRAMFSLVRHWKVPLSKTFGFGQILEQRKLLPRENGLSSLPSDQEAGIDRSPLTSPARFARLLTQPQRTDVKYSSPT